MSIPNKIIRIFRQPVPLADRILELIALVIIVSLLAFTGYLYQKAPDLIPIRFNWDYEPVDWAGKMTYWFMSAFFIVMMLVSAAAAYDMNLKFTHLPVRLKEPVKELQQLQIGRMSRCITLCLGFLWLAYLLSASASFLHTTLLADVLLKVALFCLLAVLVFFTLKVWWIGRRY